METTMMREITSLTLSKVKMVPKVMLVRLRMMDLYPRRR